MDGFGEDNATSGYQMILSTGRLLDDDAETGIAVDGIRERLWSENYSRIQGCPY